MAEEQKKDPVVGAEDKREIKRVVCMCVCVCVCLCVGARESGRAVCVLEEKKEVSSANALIISPSPPSHTRRVCAQG